jgi:ABC-type glycerol-3-phosphate transport system substrate-binding protein
MVWHAWYGAVEETYTRAVYDFNASQGEVRIELMRVDNLMNALDLIDPAGGPDLIYWGPQTAFSEDVRPYLLPLDPHLDAAYVRETFEPAAAKAVLEGESVWGIPASQEGLALIYRHDLVDAADLPPPGDLDGLLQRAAEFRRANPGRYYLCNHGLTGSDAYYAAPIYLGHGLDERGGFVDATGEAHLDTPEARAAATWIQNFSAYAPGEANYQVCQAMFIEGQVAAWWTARRSLPAVEEAGVEYGIAAMGKPYVSVPRFSLTHGARERDTVEEAIAVLRYLGSAEVQRRMALEAGTIPANSAALDEPRVQAEEEIALFGDALRVGTPLPLHRYTACQWDPIQEVTAAVWNGSAAPEAALAAAQDAIELCVSAMEE